MARSSGSPAAFAALLLLVLAPMACSDAPSRGSGDDRDTPDPGILVLHSADPDLEGLAWLTGHWASRSGDFRFEEHWNQPAAGTMFGNNRVMSGERTTFWEYLRIESGPDGIVYYASPLGRHPETPFRLVKLDGERAVFENLDHDFPQRLTYWIDDQGGLRALAWADGEGGEEPREEYFQWGPATLR